MAKRTIKPTGWVWFLDDAVTPKYTAAQVERLTGASAADLQNWANRGLIKPTSSRPGKGGRRLYTKLHVCVVAAREWLRPLGMEANYAFGAAISAVGALNKSIEYSAKVGEMRSDILKSIFCSVALVDIDDRGRFRTKIVSLAKAESNLNDVEPVLEHVLAAKPSLTIPIGNIVGRTQVAERTMNSEMSA
jgi:hypothetical protein